MTLDVIILLVLINCLDSFWDAGLSAPYVYVLGLLRSSLGLAVFFELKTVGNV